MGSGKKHIAVLGGGAAGLAAAIVAARAGARVTVFEAQERVGNTIRATGDGRCNIANSLTSADDYHNAAFVRCVFDACPPHRAVAFLESTGLLLREEGEGRLYPQANKATSAIDALRLAAARAGVEEACGRRAVALHRESGAWAVGFEGAGYARADAVVLACGGRDGCAPVPAAVPFSAYEPLLGPIATETAPLRGLDRVRVKCALRSKGRTEAGEVTFRPYGISGIAAFNMSRHVQAGDVLSIDFLPGFSQGEVGGFLHRRLCALQPRTWLEFTCGMLLPLVARAVLRDAGLPADGVPSAEGIAALQRSLTGFSLEVRGIGDARLCQVHRGGVDVQALEPATMGVRGFPGLYAAGEQVDVDGPCGGYNLHWAWTSGIVAGKAAADGQGC